jgi:hypothetical protein
MSNSHMITITQYLITWQVTWQVFIYHMTGIYISHDRCDRYDCVILILKHDYDCAMLILKHDYDCVMLIVLITLWFYNVLRLFDKNEAFKMYSYITWQASIYHMTDVTSSHERYPYITWLMWPYHMKGIHISLLILFCVVICCTFNDIFVTWYLSCDIWMPFMWQGQICHVIYGYLSCDMVTSVMWYMDTFQIYH